MECKRLMRVEYYVSCLCNNLIVKEIHRCIGDIYRDEPIKIYVNKILNEFINVLIYA
jgi:hypothetical protein